MKNNQQLGTMEYRDEHAESVIAQACQLIAQAAPLISALADIIEATCVLPTAVPMTHASAA